MEFDTNLLHAAYFKHAYIHALAHCTCDTQSSSLIVDQKAGILLVAPAVESNEWYKISSTQNLFYKSALRGIPCYRLRLYTPIVPTLDDAIAIRETGIGTVIYHKEFTQQYNNKREGVFDPLKQRVPGPYWDSRATEFLDTNDVEVIEWSGKVSNKPLNLMVRGESFNP